jgi:phytoene synthase
MAASEELTASYAHCERIARTSARNFYHGFRLLPRSKRQALCSVYAFMRYADDLADEATVPGAPGLNVLETALDGSYAPDAPFSTIMPAFLDTVARYDLPLQLFRDLIEGVRMDLTATAIATYAELERYCYHVAGVVGLVCVRIWGVSDQRRADELAVQCGTAFQLTNILRDVREDAGLGRRYIPDEDLTRFGLTPTTWLDAANAGRTSALIGYEAKRARDLYDACRPLADLIEPESRPAFLAMYLIYRGLLERIARDPHAVLRRRVVLSRAAKVGLLMKALVLARRRHSSNGAPGGH